MVKYRFLILMGCTVVALGVAHFIFVGANLERLATTATALDDQVKDLSSESQDRPSQSLVEERRARRDDALMSVGKVKAFFVDRDDDVVHGWFPETGSTAGGGKPSREGFKRGVQLARDRVMRELDSALAKLSNVEKLGNSVFAPYPWLSGSELPPKGELRRLQRTLNVEYAIHRIMAAHGARVIQPVVGAFREATSASEAMPFERTRFSFVIQTAPTNLRNVLHAFDGVLPWTYEGGEAIELCLNVHVDAVTIDRVPVNAGNANRFDGEPPVRVEFVLTHLLAIEEARR